MAEAAIAAHGIIGDLQTAALVSVAPRLDYGRRPHRTYATGSGAVFTGGGLTLTLHFVHDPGEVPPAEPHVDDGDLHAAIELVAGQASGVVLESAASGSPREVPLEEALG